MGALLITRRIISLLKALDQDLNMSYPKSYLMRIRGVNPKVIFDSSVRCQSHDIPFKIDQLECLFVGNLEKLTDVYDSLKKSR